MTAGLVVETPPPQCSLPSDLAQRSPHKVNEGGAEDTERTNQRTSCACVPMDKESDGGGTVTEGSQSRSGFSLPPWRSGIVFKGLMAVQDVTYSEPQFLHLGMEEAGLEVLCQPCRWEVCADRAFYGPLGSSSSCLSWQGARALH